METKLIKHKGTFVNSLNGQVIDYESYYLSVTEIGIYQKIDMPKNPIQKQLWKEFLDHRVDEVKVK